MEAVLEVVEAEVVLVLIVHASQAVLALVVWKAG